MPTAARRSAIAVPLAAAGVVALLVACGRTVAVDPLPIDNEETRQACAELIAGLPMEISAGRSWAVSPDPGSTIAWGSPAVLLQCGDQVPLPQATDQILQIDGMPWLITPLTQGEQYTTVGRAPGIVVTVPREYSPSAAVLVELQPSVVAGTRPR